MNKELTAVEFLINKFQLDQLDWFKTADGSYIDAKEYIKQARDLDKEINQWQKGWDDAFDLMQVSRLNKPKL